MNNDLYVWGNAKLRRRTHLPHIDMELGLYFVTWCLADAIPSGFYSRRERERARAFSDMRRRFGDVRPVDVKQHQAEWREKTLQEMDRGLGGCELADPEIARMVVQSLKHFDGDRYTLFRYAVMPNHVHVIFRPFAGVEWWRVTGGWKSFTAKNANRMLGRTGRLWQDDSWEVLIRSRAHFESASRYVLENPMRAGLRNWPWVEALPGDSNLP